MRDNSKILKVNFEWMREKGDKEGKKTVNKTLSHK
jgi:hypothetical protein